jgi:RNA polymerase sigma-70 factor (ECF subfamily)
MGMSDDDADDLLRRAVAGDAAALDRLFALHRDRLRALVRLRLNRRLRGRIDPSDVIQDAYLEVCRTLPDYLRRPALPFYLWLRHVTGQQLIAAHRRHLGARMRDAGLEVSLNQGTLPEADSAALAARLVGTVTSASRAAARAEEQLLIQAALDGMESMDREVLALRHFEMLSNEETARVLGLSKSAASNRYVRALRRLREVLSAIPGFLDPP